ncbi:MAG: FKBP-type peptidyl-prolyl cis-trans isomerase [Cyclobacteriaceae bacterium]|nr:FKBP-type peptidyl-prolyl cis-trans isomerase [Cyclobacteriaceae bacterium]
MKKISFIILVGISVSGCLDDQDECTKAVPESELSVVDQTRLASDIITIDSYLAANSIIATEEPNGVRYVITKQGDGTTPCLESTISVTYTGKLYSGTVFDSSATPVSFPLERLIVGWKLVLPLLQAGTKVTLYIPSGYGYGPQGGANGAIPSNANLIFDIELLAVL